MKLNAVLDVITSMLCCALNASSPIKEEKAIISQPLESTSDKKVAPKQELREVGSNKFFANTE